MTLEAALLAAVEAYPDNFKSLTGAARKGGLFAKEWESKLCVTDAVGCHITDRFMMKRSPHLAFAVLVYQGTDERIANAAYDVVAKHLLAMKFPFATVSVDNQMPKPVRFRLWIPKASTQPDPKYDGLTIELEEMEYLTGKERPEPTEGHTVFVRIGKG